MTLPEPARTLWRAHGAALQAAAEAHGTENRLVLGGGTVLAARWKHRDSSDLDLLLPDRESLKDTGPGGRRDLAKATGGKYNEINASQINITFAEGKLDLTAVEPRLPGLEAVTDVEGRQVTVLANAQILQGKCFRTEKGVTRDAFDIAVAGEADPRSLEIAINSLSNRDARVIRHNLITSNDAMVTQAEEGRLTGVAPRYQKYLDHLGIAAAEAIDAHRYTRVRILATEKGIRIETQTEGSATPRRDEYTGQDAAKTLVESGIGAYLNTNSKQDSRELGWTLDDVAAKRWTGTVFDSYDSRPDKRLEKVQRAAGIERPKPLSPRDQKIPPAPVRPASTARPTKPEARSRVSGIDTTKR